MLPGEARAAGPGMSPARAAGVAGGPVAGFASAWTRTGDPDVAGGGGGGGGGGERSFKVPPVRGDALRAATHGEAGVLLHATALEIKSWNRVVALLSHGASLYIRLSRAEECRVSASHRDEPLSHLTRLRENMYPC